MSTGRPDRFRDAAGRTAAQDEVHARPIDPVKAPARIRRVAFLLKREPTAAQDAAERFGRWCREAGVTPPAAGERRAVFVIGDRRVVWELHTEFVTLTWSGLPKDGTAWPDGIGLDAHAAQPVIAAVRIDVESRDTIGQAALHGFDPLRLCHSRIDGGMAEVATDFILDPEGFSRYEFAAGRLGSIRRGLLVRGLLEIETYRVLALLGLPLARSLSPEIGDIELRLARLMGRMGTASTTADNHAALDELHALSVRVGQVGEETRFRFAATKAYGELLAQRFEGLGESVLGENNTLRRYLAHRTEPALATCLAVEKRQAALATTLAQTTDLLNTRIGVDLQNQNQSLLNTISETARSQYRLQTTVEGLSTIAISYYLLAILGYVLHGAEERLHFDKSLIVAALAPLVLAGVWLSMRRIKKRHAVES